MPNPKLPALDTFNSPAQLTQLRALRNAVLKSRRDYFPNTAEGNAWFAEAQQRLDALSTARQAAVPSVPFPAASMQPRARGADINAHVVVKTLPTIKQTEGAPRVKVLNDPLGSHKPKTRAPAPSSAPTVVRPNAVAGRAMVPAARVLPASTAARKPALPLLTAIETKFRHANMAGEVFQALRRAALEANHGNTEQVEELISHAEQVEQQLCAELAAGGALNVVRPPAPPPALPTPGEATSDAP